MAIIQEYAYRAFDPVGGAVVKGTVEAAGETAVTAKLRAQGLTPLEIAVVAKTGLNRDVSIPGMERRVKTESLAVLTKQMAGLVNAGLPLMRTLAVLAEQTEDKRLQAAMLAVHAEVESGASLSAALAKQPTVFPSLMVSIVLVGETGGFLGQALQSIAETFAKEAELHNKIRSAMTYPVVVLVIAIVGVLAMITFIVPIFKEMFEGMGTELPLPTQLLVTLSANMVWILPVLVVLALGGWLWWTRNKDTERVRRVVDPLKLRLPVFGKLTTKIAVARFARNLSMMLTAGVPLIQALAIVGQASSNWTIENAVRDVQESVRRGRSFAAPLAKAGVFPPMVAQMVAVGEEAGTLPEMLESIADFYEGEVQTATDQLTTAIEPILIVGIGVLVGGMVVALYLPIFTLYSDLSQTGA